MFRSTVLGTLGLAFFPAAATAQFMPALVPPNPLYQHPAYRYQFSVGPSVPTAFGRTFVGMTAPATRAPQILSPNWGVPYTRYTSPWGQSGVPRPGYISGGSLRSELSSSAQRDFERAQRDAVRFRDGPDAAKKMIADQWTYEKIGLAGLPGVALAKTTPEALGRALTSAPADEISSGEALNPVLAAIAAAEAKGAKGVSAFLPPQILDEIRFAGGPPADALNLLRRAGRLSFPAAFDAPELRELRDLLDKDFSAAVAPALAGKAVDPQKLTKLEQTLKRLEEAAPPVIRNLSFEDAIPARRFLNQMTTATRALKGSGAVGLLNPTWATEGSNVSDLARHMVKFKLQFAAAPAGADSAYLALHKALATYLYALSPPKK